MLINNISFISSQKFKTVFKTRLIDIYEQSYYRRTFDIQQITGEYYDFSRLSSRRVRTAISEPWNGKNYSERVWNNTFETAEKLRDVVVSGIMSGQSYKTMESSFLAVMGEDSDSGARFKASRLIRTEVNYISGKATGKAYEEAGIEEYTYIATLDIHTCKNCGDEKKKSCAELDGEHFKVSEAKVGVNKHPMHPFCRCTDCPYIPGRKTVRAARDENGKSIQVPGDMSYDEWYDKYVDNFTENGIMGVGSDKMLINKSVSASPLYISEHDDLYRNATKVEPIDGYEDIVIHADKNKFYSYNMLGHEFEFTPTEMASIIKQSRDYNGGDIRLIACEAASKDATAAQELANVLNVNVLAPSDIVWIDDVGKMTIGKIPNINTGEWILLKPNKE